MALRGTFSFGYGLTPWVKRLLIANGALFLVLWATRGALIPALEFTPRLALVRPWTFLTYMFVHAGFWHLFFNLLALFFFGPPLEERWGPREFLKYYLVCGLGGALLSFAFAWNASIVGASAAVYGIMLAFALYWPDAPIYVWGIFPVKAKWLVLFFGALSLLGAFGAGGDGVAHFAHLGGLAAGFLYLKAGGAAAAQLARLRKLVPRRRFTVIPGQQAAAGPARRAGRRDRREEQRLQDEVDRVLEKISTSGLASLTPEERRLLDEVSKRYRQN